jgi:hypothetical protein
MSTAGGVGEGFPHSNRDGPSLERAKRSEGSASHRDNKTWKPTTNHAVVTNHVVPMNRAVVTTVAL